MNRDTKNLYFIGDMLHLNSSQLAAEIKKHGPGAGMEGNDQDRKFKSLMDDLDHPQYYKLWKSRFSYIRNLAGIHGDFYRSPTMNRLSRIKQLGIISTDIFFNCNQTREVHSDIVAMLAEIVMDSYDFTEDEINLAIASGLLHDAAMPPMSDQGKLANRAELDEEDNIIYIVERPDVKKILDNYGIRPEDVVACVRGEYPTIGRLLNSSEVDLDKISYTALDTFHLFNETVNKAYAPNNLGIDPRQEEKDEVINQIYGALAHPDLFDIYQDMEITSDREVLFRDPRRLYNFLKIRALMFKYVYRNPINVAREAFLRRHVEDLWNDGTLNREGMLNMTDGDFETILRQRLPRAVYNAAFSDFPEDHLHPIHRTTTMTEEELKVIFPGDEYVVAPAYRFNPSTSTAVKSNRHPYTMPFSEAFPIETSEIEDIASDLNYINVYRMEDSGRDWVFPKFGGDYKTRGD